MTQSGRVVGFAKTRGRPVCVIQRQINGHRYVISTRAHTRRAALEYLTAPWSHALRIQAGTGWHTTEVVGFARGGSVEPLPKHAKDKGSAGVLVCPRHKNGEPHRTRVTTDVLAAAEKLLGPALLLGKVAVRRSICVRRSFVFRRIPLEGGERVRATLESLLDDLRALLVGGLDLDSSTLIFTAI